MDKYNRGLQVGFFIAWFLITLLVFIIKGNSKEHLKEQSNQFLNNEILQANNYILEICGILHKRFANEIDLSKNPDDENPY